MTRRTDWLELPQAIELVGPRLFSEWSGHEKYSPVYSELSADLARLADLTPNQIAQEYRAWRAGIEAQAKQERLAREATDAKPSGIREGLEKLRDQLAGEMNPRRRRALEKTIETLSKEPTKAEAPAKSRSQIALDRREFITEDLRERLERSYGPGLAARRRWWDAHMTIGEEVMAGRVRARLDRPGAPSIESWRQSWSFPPPGDYTTIIDGIPAVVALAKADLDAVFAPRTTCPEEPATGDRKRRRSQTPERDRIKAAIVKALEEGRETPDTLDKISEEALRTQYGVKPGIDNLASRDTCRKAKKEALSEFVARQGPTIDK
jgi:hypothetical protein